MTEEGEKRLSPLAWTEAITEISEKGLRRNRQATEDERRAVAEALDIVSCEHLDASYRVVARGPQGYALEGTVEVDVTQECVVTLEPVQAHLHIDLAVDFVAEPQAAVGDEVDPFARAEVEPIENGHLAVGRIVLEEVASHLDPYPRAPGSNFEWREEASPAATHPFAALARLKKAQDDG
jgi:uncharacterized metal-binding protein YceD (DUF177 family)